MSITGFTEAFDRAIHEVDSGDTVRFDDIRRAAPFVQGRLRQEHLSTTIETTCGHCNKAIHITVDSDMKVSVYDERADPLVFMPQVDWQTFTEPNIINAY